MKWSRTICLSGISRFAIIRTRLLLAAAFLPLGLSGTVVAGLTATSTIAIEVLDAGNAISPTLTLWGDPPPSTGSMLLPAGDGDYSISVFRTPMDGSRTQITGTTGPSFVPEFTINFAAGDKIELEFQVQSSEAVPRSYLRYQLAEGLTFPDEGPRVYPEYDIESEVTAMEALTAGESGDSSASVNGSLEILASTSGNNTSLTSSDLTFGDLDPTISIQLAANSEFNAVPEPSPFSLLCILAVLGACRSRFAAR